MSKWPRQGHFRYLRFKTFPMAPRTPQFEVFWAFLSSSKHSGVSEDSKSPTLEVLGFSPTLGQSGVATHMLKNKISFERWQKNMLEACLSKSIVYVYQNARCNQRKNAPKIYQNNIYIGLKWSPIVCFHLHQIWDFSNWSNIWTIRE